MNSPKIVRGWDGLPRIGHKRGPLWVSCLPRNKTSELYQRALDKRAQA